MNYILDYINRNGFVTVKELSNLLKKTRKTIRNYLKYLEDKNLIECSKYSLIAPKLEKTIIEKLEKRNINQNTTICISKKDFKDYLEDLIIDSEDNDIEVIVEIGDSKRDMLEYIKDKEIFTYRMISRDLGISENLAKRNLRYFLKEGIIVCYPYNKIKNNLDEKLIEILKKYDSDRIGLNICFSKDHSYFKFKNK